MSVEVTKKLGSVKIEDGWAYLSFLGDRDFVITTYNWKALGKPVPNETIKFTLSTEKE